MDENPYRSPLEASDTHPATEEVVAGRAGTGRFIAAQIDHMFAVVLFLVVGMNSASAIGDIAAGIAALSAYLCYYFVPEWVFGTTIGKSLFALRVQQISGQPCSAHQAAVRTLLRLVEVNPLLFGAIPAGIAILSTKRKQRIGDLLAGTIVVHRNDVTTSDQRPTIRVICRTNRSSVE